MIVDLRSDTVTRPTKGMLEAMMNARVGDDVFGEDPEINALHKTLADMFGQEAGLFCPSGTMTNQVAIMTHTRPGDEVICSDISHIYLYEGGGVSANSGVQTHLLEGDRGRLDASIVAAAIRPNDAHFPISTLVSVEDTCNKGGGVFYDIGQIRDLHRLTREKGMKLHLDGARVFNALVETGTPTKEYGQYFDSISICLSKGLGAPVGSVLLGSKEFIHRAHRNRKRLGGGMRQAGYLAAAAQYAIDNHVERLLDDHANAKHLAHSLSGCGWVKDVWPVHTNIVVAGVEDQEGVLASLKERGVWAIAFGAGLIRMVTHLDATEDKIEYACDQISSI